MKECVTQTIRPEQLPLATSGHTDGMRVRIHRGTKEIGGTCVELESSGLRVLLDLGLPLDAEEAKLELLPDVSGLREDDASLLAIVLSHGHRDHWGLIPLANSSVPLILGAGTERIMRAASLFVPGGFAPTASQHLQDRKPVQVGPFTITPYLVDHSGFDAYALLVEAGGKRLFYSGDLRAHGRKGALFERLLRDPPGDIDIMLMEGSSIGRIGEDESFPSEADLEEEFVQTFQSTSGMALVACSAQNIDRVVTLYRAAKRTGRRLVVDAYAAEVLKATGSPNIPKPVEPWKDIQVFIPQRQRLMLKKNGIAPIVDSYKGRRIWPEQLAKAAAEFVILVRPWMLDELSSLGALQGAVAVWSQWEGYLREGSGKEFKADCTRRGIPFHQIHTSGHASVSDLKRLSNAIKPTRLTPIHTFSSAQFDDLFSQVAAYDDGQLWSVE
jgi:ribonuclease J